MILVIDDDEAIAAQVCEVLVAGGHPASPFVRVADLLVEAASEEPELIISDVMMPEHDGFEVRRLYERTFPERATPFVFLSSLDDSSTIARALDEGADDWLVKPVAADVLLAKVRAIERRARRALGQRFRGDLAALSLSAVLRFCESRGLTGYVDVLHGGATSRIAFRAGQLEDAGAIEKIGALLTAADGQFVICSTPVAFDELRRAGGRQPAPPDLPIGRVSGVRVRGRLLQVQTEPTGAPDTKVVTVVQIEGRTAWKRVTHLPGASAADVQAAIDEQHERVEAEVERKLAEVIDSHKDRARNRLDEFHRLCDEGFDLFRAGDFAAAAAAWEAALAIDPSSTATAVNARIARERAARPRE